MNISDSNKQAVIIIYTVLCTNSKLFFVRSLDNSDENGTTISYAFTGKSWRGFFYPCRAKQLESYK